MIGGLALLAWVPTVPSVHLLNRVAGVLAASSLYIYLTHWQVYGRLADTAPLLAVLASLAAGIGYATVATRATATLSSLRRRRPWPWSGRQPSNQASTGGARSTNDQPVDRSGDVGWMGAGHAGGTLHG